MISTRPILLAIFMNWAGSNPAQSVHYPLALFPSFTPVTAARTISWNEWPCLAHRRSSFVPAAASREFSSSIGPYQPFVAPPSDASHSSSSHRRVPNRGRSAFEVIIQKI
ncbi:unnamed protein product [Citrullus colocynthis]|uniref:Secreted protein n=1 Tax=Citrullus colocynthis TaxID=252529 RepID=A0ABP0YRR8_9ROSI